MLTPTSDAIFGSTNDPEKHRKNSLSVVESGPFTVDFDASIEPWRCVASKMTRKCGLWTVDFDTMHRKKSLHASKVVPLHRKALQLLPTFKCCRASSRELHTSLSSMKVARAGPQSIDCAVHCLVVFCQRHARTKHATKQMHCHLDTDLLQHLFFNTRTTSCQQQTSALDTTMTVWQRDCTT